MERAGPPNHELGPSLSSKERWTWSSATQFSVSKTRESLEALTLTCYEKTCLMVLACFKLWGLPANVGELSERLPRRYEKGPQDIFAIVKHHLCDSTLSQPPLLVLPQDEKQTSKRFWSNSVNDNGFESSIDTDRQADLLELSEAFGTYPNYERAVTYLKSLAGHGRRIRYEVNALPFVSSGGAQPPGLVCANALPRPQRLPPHQLHVRFHRP